jgi:hypothetical protein
VTRLRRGIGIGLTTAGVLVAVAVAVAMLALARPSHTTTTGRAQREAATHVPRSARLDGAGWAAVRSAAQLRAMALAPGRTAAYRSFAARMGLEELLGLRPIRRGRCADAVLYLYNNLLDLHDASPGEDWRPLRHLVRMQPSLSVCKPAGTRYAA